ncbi:imm11 family protein [Rhodopirellula bahusiensis]|nr:DUF1629 domain-containing protein [Rhodopirellula bahusiensis]
MTFDDPRFEAIDFDQADSLFGGGTLDDDFNSGLGVKLSWSPKSFSNAWVPPVVAGALRPFVDLTRVAIRHPVYSPRAVEVLGDLLLRSGELLPVKTVAGTYYIFNIHHISDALDRQHSKISFPAPGSSKETAFGIDYHVFNPNRLDGHAIFRVRECPQRVYVTEEYKSQVESASLNGFCFNKVWPLEENADWKQLAAKAARLRSRDVANLNGESMTISLAIAGSKPTQSEIDIGYKIAEQVANCLADSQSQISDDYIGGVEQTEASKKALLIHLSGPNSQEIFTAVEPLVNQIEWPNPVDVIVWKGNRNNKKTEKSRIKVKRPLKKPQQ